MKGYDVKENPKKVVKVYFWEWERNGKKGVKIELWRKKPNFDKIPLGENHYNIEDLFVPNEQDYWSLLLAKREATTCKKYLKRLGFVPKF